jgi:hypothetical protein
MAIREFSNGRAAMERRFELEQALDTAVFEVVVLSAPDLETIQRTHSRYFGGPWAFNQEL